MTNFERIKNMNKNGWAEFVDDLLSGYDNSVVSNWFNKNYCESICPEIEVIYNDKTEKWKECDFEGVCPYQDCGRDIINLWLDAESEE